MIIMTCLSMSIMFVLSFTDSILFCFQEHAAKVKINNAVYLHCCSIKGNWSVLFIMLFILSAKKSLKCQQNQTNEINQNI